MKSWLIVLCVVMLTGTTLACDKAPGCCEPAVVAVPVVAVQPVVCCVRDLRAERLARREARRAARCMPATCCPKAEPVTTCAPKTAAVPVVVVPEPVAVVVQVCCAPVVKAAVVCNRPLKRLLEAVLPPYRRAVLLVDASCCP